MSLVTCPECKKQVSDTAISCPNCGFLVSNYFSSEKAKENTQLQNVNSPVKMQNAMKQSGPGIAGMILGIIALAILPLGFLGIIGLPLSICGDRQKECKKGCANAGIALNIIALVFFFIIIFFKMI